MKTRREIVPCPMSVPSQRLKRCPAPKNAAASSSTIVIVTSAWSPGFVWRLQTEDGNATAIRVFEQDAEGSDGGILINMSVWESVEALAAYLEAEDRIKRSPEDWTCPA